MLLDEVAMYVRMNIAYHYVMSCTNMEIVKKKYHCVKL